MPLAGHGSTNLFLTERKGERRLLKRRIAEMSRTGKEGNPVLPVVLVVRMVPLYEFLVMRGCELNRDGGAGLE